jgi:hypothetical protein
MAWTATYSLPVAYELIPARSGWTGLGAGDRPVHRPRRGGQERARAQRRTSVRACAFV